MYQVVFPQITFLCFSLCKCLKSVHCFCIARLHERKIRVEREGEREREAGERGEKLSEGE
jgi:hypothetical protein